jgi:hypothetical protein
MPRYDTNLIDLKLPSGQEFSVAVCSYSGMVRHMIIGQDFIRRTFINFVEIENDKCQSGEHCLALDCQFNRAKPDHLAHMLDMPSDEPIDDDNYDMWGTRSTVNALIKFAKTISDDLRKNQPQE